MEDMHGIPLRIGDRVAHISRSGSSIYAKVGFIIEERQQVALGYPSVQQVRLQFVRDWNGDPIDKKSSWINAHNVLSMM